MTEYDPNNPQHQQWQQWQQPQGQGQPQQPQQGQWQQPQQGQWQQPQGQPQQPQQQGHWQQPQQQGRSQPSQPWQPQGWQAGFGAQPAMAGAQPNYGSTYSAAQASVDDRAAFLVKTYLHLIAAVFAFVIMETGLFLLGVPEMVFPLMANQIGWMVVLGLFIGAGWLARYWARNSTSLLMQYAGLGLYVFSWTLVFMPLMYVGTMFPGAIGTAAIVTVVLFGGLTGIVFFTRKDFSFLKGILGVATLAAFGTIIAAMIFGFQLGVFFSGAMILLAGGHILYDTSNVLHHYRTDQYVGASLELFAGVALLFWYVLRLVIQMQSRR
jgi:FtsH-binding integral membrane protein